MTAFSGVLHKGLLYLPSMLYLIGILSCFGMTMAISLLSDLLCLFTAHIYVCYLISTTVYHHQLKTAASLWNLFHGSVLNSEERTLYADRQYLVFHR